MNIQKQKVYTWGMVIALLFAPFCIKLFSQEYKYEIGSTAGISSYMGDANRTKPFLHPKVTGGALFRYNFDLQWAFKTTLLGGSVSGNSFYSGNRFPADQQASFQRAFADIGAQVEFHFFRYSDEYEYLGTRPYTPYLFIGGGVTLAGGENPFFGINVPLGIGFKYKVKKRMNVGVEVATRKLFKDNFDVVKHSPGWNLDTPFGIESSSLKNQDWYSFALIYLTWDFGLKDDPCR